MAHPVDVHVGKKIRQRRWITGITQQKLASDVGIKFQQIQKYETAMNRVSSSRLWEISRVLGVDVPYFFTDYAIESDVPAPAANSPQAIVPSDIFADREAMELLRCYFTIPETQRKKLFDLARVLSDSE